MAFTFTENGFPACDSGDNAFNGFTVLLRSGRCEALDDASLELMLAPWVVHTVNHQSYGTIFQSIPPETVSARMVALATPASPACGEWTVNIEVAGIDSSGLGNGPFSAGAEQPGRRHRMLRHHQCDRRQSDPDAEPFCEAWGAPSDETLTEFKFSRDQRSSPDMKIATAILGQIGG